MFREYEKTYRIPHPEVSNKLNISDQQLKELLTGFVIVEEKIDGANTGIIGLKRDQFRLQKRSSLVDTSEHPQYGRFKAWSIEHYNDLIKIPQGVIAYGEFMWATHHIYYNELPDWFICFDVFHKNYGYLNRTDKEKFCNDFNLKCVPLIAQGYFNKKEIMNMLDGNSAYNSFSFDKISNKHIPCFKEGIVVKNYRKQKRAKLVRPDFIKELNEDGTHWMTLWDPSRINKLKELV